MLENIFVCEVQDAHSVLRQNRAAPLVSPGLNIMAEAIQFDGQALPPAQQIAVERADLHLTAELEAVEPTVAQVAP
jgi:hypothetical protein